MNRLICWVLWMSTVIAGAQDDLRPALEVSYNAWRNAVINKDARAWESATAEHRRMEVKNRILSEKRAFPATVFNLPTPPPSIDGLLFLDAKQNRSTAKASYFGKIDFGVGGTPTDNLIVLSFIRGKNGWLYDRADFVNLAALSAVRQELAKGDLRYLKETPEAQPTGVVPSTPVEMRPAKIIAKVYVFCPGREVQVQVNKFSRHRFANAKEAEIIIGGARDGLNEVQFSTKKIEGGTGKEAMTIRVYLLSEVEGVKPIKIFEYQVQEGGEVLPFGTKNFTVDAATMKALESGS